MRTTIFVLSGILLLLLNLWFVRSVNQAWFARDVVLAPFEVFEQGGSGHRQSEALARILNVRLALTLRELAAARQAVSASPAVRRDDSARADGLPAATLFLPEEVVIPSDLLRPVDFRVAVAGVEVGGLLSWLHRAILRPKTLTFTVIEKGDTALVTADLTGFIDSGDPYVSVECKKAPDEIATAAAYALIQRRLSTGPQRSFREFLRDGFSRARPRGDADTRLMLLEPADFRLLIEAILAVDRLNAKVRRGYVLDREFDGVLASIDPLPAKLPDYYELQYFMGSVAESAGNKTKAAGWYRSIVAATTVSESILTDAKQRLARLETAVPAAARGAEDAFREESHRFAELMGLAGAHPRIVFKEQQVEGLQAMWNGDAHQYEVNSKNVETSGLPQYVALMGRFMEQHYERCFGDDTKQPGDGTFWNQFRIGVVDYLIRSVPEFSQVDSYGSEYPMFAVLKHMEMQTGQAPKRLALELLTRYDCDWNATNIEQHVLAVSSERGLLAPEIVRNAFKAVAPPKPTPSVKRQQKPR